MHDDGLRSALNKLQNSNRHNRWGCCGLTKQESADLRHTILTEDTKTIAGDLVRILTYTNAFQMRNQKIVQDSIIHILDNRR